MAHGAGCSCAGHVALSLDPAAVEADVLDYLAGRYDGLGERALVEFIAKRQAARGVTFATWLGGLDAATLSPAERARLMADLDATISSLVQA